MLLDERARVCTGRKEDRRWYTPTEVAKACQVTSHAVRHWLRDGRLAGFRHGAYWQVKADALESFVRQRARPVG